jgi:hypothetical protein
MKRILFAVALLIQNFRTVSGTGYLLLVMIEKELPSSSLS